MLPPYSESQEWKDFFLSFGKSDKIVVYCGAGVTMDRTGLTWSRMVAEAYKVDGAVPEFRYPSKNTQEILSRSQDSEALAGLLEESLSFRHGDNPNAARKHVQQRLHSILYDENAWKSGYVSSSIMDLVEALIGLKKRCILVTTNYEDYLTEKAHIEVERRFPSYLGGEDVTDGDFWGSEGEPVPVYYIHGRVPKEHGSEPSGQLTITERDYAERYISEVKFLTDLFSESGELLIVGASMKDRPLLGALAATSKKPGRWVLFPISNFRLCADEYSQTQQVARAFRARGRALGLRVLVPNYFSDISQMLGDLSSYLSARGYEDKSFDDRYRLSTRLNAWASIWLSSLSPSIDHDNYSAQHLIYDRLENTLDRILRGRSRDDADRMRDIGEYWRLELWVRSLGNPLEAIELRGTSTGPIFIDQYLNTKILAPESSNAAVQSIHAGSPITLDVNSLAGAETLGRWKSFLAVPIYIPSPDGMWSYCPGSVILASNRHNTQFAVHDDASILPLEPSSMNTLVEALESLGADLLDTRP